MIPNLLLIISVIATLTRLMNCGNYTVTHEAWFEVELLSLHEGDNSFSGKFTIALFGEAAPITVRNIFEITNGYSRKQGKSEILHYKNSLIHKIVQDFAIQMGDITNGDGTGGVSIYGTYFNDENFYLTHRGPGWVAMANAGSDTNSSQFYILMTRARWLNKKHVVFGKVIRGFDLIQRINDVPVTKRSQTPTAPIKIMNCGAKKLDKPYDLKPSQLDSIEDIPE